MHFRYLVPCRLGISKCRTETCANRLPCVFRCQVSSVAVEPALSESLDTKDVKPVAKVDERYHRMMQDLSRLESNNAYPHFKERQDQLLIQNDIRNVVRMLTIYEEIVSQVTEEDGDQILKIYSDKLIGEEKAILWSVGQDDKPAERNENKGEGLPSREQLQYIHDSLAAQLPLMFKKPLDYRIYHKNIVFINNLRGTKTVGLVPYVKQVALLRILGHLKFSYVKFEILKITSHPEEGAVKVRWRINGISGLRSMLFFWNIKLWDLKKTKEQMSESWYDGFSTFKVGSDGLIHAHIADKMMPDDERPNVKVPLAVKVAALIGLMPRPMTDFSDFFESSDTEKTLQVIERIQKGVTDV